LITKNLCYQFLNLLCVRTRVFMWSFLYNQLRSRNQCPNKIGRVVGLLSSQKVYIFELVLHLGFGTGHLLDSSGEGVLDAVGLLAHVLRSVLENVVDELPHWHGRHALILGRHDVVVRVLRPGLGSWLTIGRVGKYILSIEILFKQTFL